MKSIRSIFILHFVAVCLAVALCSCAGKSGPDPTVSFVTETNENGIGIGFYPVDSDVSYGNTAGNIINYGFAAVQGDWVYFSSKADNDHLYKTRADGTERTLLDGNQAISINVVGDWVYYYSWRYIGHHMESGKPVDDNGYSGIYKIRTDGTEKTQLNNDISNNVIVADGWVYYRNIGDGYSLYRIRTDGSERTQLSNHYVDYINVSGDWIYYYRSNERGGIYRIRTDGKRRTKLYDSGAYDLNVVGDWIYFEGSGGIYKVGIDGKNAVKLVEGSYCRNINVADGWIYYIDGRFWGNIYRIRTDGTEKTVLVDEGENGRISILGDQVLYRVYDQSNSDNPYAIYTMLADGSDRRPFE